MSFHANPVLVLVSAAFVGAALTVSAGAQSQPSTPSVDAIVQSEVHEEQARAAADPEKVIAAIEKSSESTAAVRKASKLDKVDIVFLTDSGRTEGGPPPEVAAKVEEHEDEIEQLRDEIEGNAMLYHAIDSRQILVDDVLAVEFDGSEGVVIYAAAKPPAQ